MLTKKMQGNRIGTQKDLARKAADNLRYKAVAWSSDMENGFVVLTQLLTGKQIKPSQLDMYALEEVEHLWSICMFVFCRDSKGEQYMRSIETRAPEKCLQAQLVESLNGEHMKLVNGVNSRDVLTIAWVASVGPLSSNAAMKQLGKKPADWEMKREVIL